MDKLRDLVAPAGFLVAVALAAAGWFDIGFVASILAGGVALTVWTYLRGFDRLVVWQSERGLIRFGAVTALFVAGHTLIAALLYGAGIFARWLVT